jgi:hypothetical protein
LYGSLNKNALCLYTGLIGLVFMLEKCYIFCEVGIKIVNM